MQNSLNLGCQLPKAATAAATAGAGATKATNAVPDAGRASSFPTELQPQVLFGQMSSSMPRQHLGQPGGFQFVNSSLPTKLFETTRRCIVRTLSRIVRTHLRASLRILFWCSQKISEFCC